jgi:microcystin-dependent protein
MDPLMAQITLFAGNYAPRGWLTCDGQVLPISQNTALFSLLGTTFGGNGQTTYALPDLRGRVAIHAGTGPGLTARVLGAKGGLNDVGLLTTQIPAHTHIVNPRFSNTPNQVNPAGNYPGNLGAANPATGSTASGPMGAASVAPAGSSAPHENMQPYLGINYIIATQGIFPSRN